MGVTGGIRGPSIVTDDHGPDQVLGGGALSVVSVVWVHPRSVGCPNPPCERGSSDSRRKEADLAASIPRHPFGVVEHLLDRHGPGHIVDHR